MVAEAYRGVRLLSVGLCLAAVVVGCGSTPFTPPPDAAGPEVVLNAYLTALKAGDCSAGTVLATSTFRKGHGDLCGATTVSGFSVRPSHATVRDGNEVVFATSLSTSGTADGSVPAGDITWFFSIDRQTNGSWRLVGGGSGP